MALNNTDQSVFFGTSGSSEYLAQQLTRIGGTRILCVTGRASFQDSGGEALLSSALKTQASCHFSEFGANPELGELSDGLDCFRNFSPDCIIAVGGGSVLDMAKLINFFGSTQLDPLKYFKTPIYAENSNLLPMIAIPTTAGTGSEATCFSVLYKERKKYSVEHPNMLPSVVILNHELTESMAPYQVACSGFDAFSQALESFWAVGSTEQTRKYSAEAISLCMRHLEGAVLRPTPEHRKGMMKAAHLAGKAINIAKTTAAHALSYTLTSCYGLPHGHAVAMFLPLVLKLNAVAQEVDLNDPRGIEFVNARMDDLYAMLNCNSPNDASEFLQRLILRIGLGGEWVGTSGVDIDELHTCIVNHVNMERMGNNPRRFSSADLKLIASRIQ